MASFLQMDIKDLFTKKKNTDKKVSDSNIQKILIKRMFSILLILILIFISYWFLLKPRFEKQAIKIDELSQWKDQIISCDQENKDLNDKLTELNHYNEEKGKLFVSDEEFEDFYAKLYEATGNLNLQIMDVTRKEETPIYVSDSNSAQNVVYNDHIITTSCSENFDTSLLDSNIDSNTISNYDSCEQNNEGVCKEIAYYKMFVDFEIRGTFENYINFRNIIASEKNIVNIESEEILRDKLNIIAKATVSLVKTP